MLPLSIDRAIDQALQHQAGGRLQEAERIYRTVLAAEPTHPEANHNLGVLLLGLNRLQDALQHLKTALDAEPRDGQVWVSYIDALIHAGQYQAARAVLASGRRRGLAGPAIVSLQRRLDVLEPDQFAGSAPLDRTGQPAAAGPRHASTKEKSQVVALQRERRYGEAEALTRTLATRFPDDHWSWKALGGLLRSQGRFDEALQAARTAVHLAPEDPQAHFELGLAFDGLGQAIEAEASIRRALQLNPQYAEAHNQLGMILDRTTRSQEAETCYRRALAIRPDWPAAQSNLAVALTYQEKLEEAEKAFGRAIALEPEGSGHYVNLAVALRRHGKLAEAEAALRRAIALKPDNGSAHADLARILRETDRLAEAEEGLRRAIERFPLMTEARSDLLYSLNYSAERSPQYCLEEARRYGEAVSRRVRRAYSSWTHVSHPTRLRIGITSSDIHSHPVGYFLEGVLRHLDQNRVELISYPTNPIVDSLTQRVRPHFAALRPLNGLSDEAAAQQIHRDGIHVLVELSGHTPHNRLPILAWKPAPIQVNWLGYFATTGVKEIDYFLADEVSVPYQHESHFTEHIWYLPDTRLCFTPPDSDTTVQPLPALQSNSVTFGSFQGPAKLNDKTLSLWARVLKAVPGARLRIQSQGLASEALQGQLIRRLEAAGVAAERVSLHGPVTRPLYLAAHAEVDVILDTMPFTGGTTTCEALWMGVPTLTIAGDRLVSRQGASLMRAAGLPEWVAGDEDRFVEKAAAFANEPGKLSELRAGLRERLVNTPLFDGRRFAANLEAALWQMWERCQQRR